MSYGVSVNNFEQTVQMRHGVLCVSFNPISTKEVGVKLCFPPVSIFF